MSIKDYEIKSLINMFKIIAQYPEVLQDRKAEERIRQIIKENLK